MKFITLTLTTLLISGLAGAHDMRNSTSRPEPSQRGYYSEYSGSSTVPPDQQTMNDRNKMLEACRSIHTEKSCDEIIQSCMGETDQITCVHSYMKK